MVRVLIGSTVFLTCIFYALAHSHSHEAPHLKYGREVNEAAQKGDDDIYEDHGHSHSHHGHSHEHLDDEFDHGHAHEHAHTHSHGHTHENLKEDASHGHADCGHDHTHSAPKSKPNLNSNQTPKKQQIKEYVFDKKGYFGFLNDPKTRLWTYSLGSTLFISAVPCFILIFIPIKPNMENSSLLKILLALGAGGLLGDAFLHLIPHAQMASGGDHGHTHSHSHASGEPHEPHDNFVGLWVLGGLLFFFVSEKFLRIATGGHGHSHGEHKEPVKKDKKKKAKKSDNEDSSPETDHDEQPILHEKHDERDEHKKISAWLNLGADFMHNFTDGLAIGASFITGTAGGIGTVIMVFFHEIPHEIGDFAILVRSGYSKKRAMFTQLLTALGAFAGCAIALWSVDPKALSEAAEKSWVTPFTAGGFIYIAAVSVLPELLEKSSFLLTIGEVIAMGIGVLCMYLIALFE